MGQISFWTVASLQGWPLLGEHGHSLALQVEAERAVRGLSWPACPLWCPVDRGQAAALHPPWVCAGWAFRSPFSWMKIFVWKSGVSLLGWVVFLSNRSQVYFSFPRFRGKSLLLPKSLSISAHNFSVPFGYWDVMNDVIKCELCRGERSWLAWVLFLRSISGNLRWLELECGSYQGTRLPSPPLPLTSPPAWIPPNPFLPSITEWTSTLCWATQENIRKQPPIIVT